MIDLQRLDLEMTEARTKIADGCPKCDGVGCHVPDDEDIDPDTLEPKVVPCECVVRLRREISLIDGNVPREFRRRLKRHFDLFSDGPNSEVADLLRTYVSKFKAARRHGLGFLFSGENGTGKTLASSWLLTRAIARGYSVFYSTVEEWLQAVTQGYRDEEFAEWVDSKRDVDFLVLDELGKEHRARGSDFALAQIDRLIRSRSSGLLPTVVVTNLGVDELEDAVGSSLASILRGRRFRTVEFEPGDHRGSVDWEELLEDAED